MTFSQPISFLTRASGDEGAADSSGADAVALRSVLASQPERFEAGAGAVAAVPPSGLAGGCGTAGAAAVFGA